MELQFLGSGDAFGSGGRLNTCIQVKDSLGAFLVDCGASSMIALRKFAVNPNDLRAILISHLHGDHFGGLPFFLLDAHMVSRRSAPLTIAGPPGLCERLQAALACLFPGSERTHWRFELNVQELTPGQVQEVVSVQVTPFIVEHPCGAPPFALRLEVDGRVLCYSGDTHWVPALAQAARNADLFIAEGYFFDRRVKYHLDYATLATHLPAIGAKRVILTHMSQEMLSYPGAIECESAEDGLTITV